MALQHVMILPKEFLINFLPIYEGPLTEIKNINSNIDIDTNTVIMQVAVRNILLLRTGRTVERHFGEDI